MTTPHNPRYRPPFPTLQVVLHTDRTRSEILIALVDSGADGTLVPEALLQEIGAPESGDVTLRTHFGDTQRLARYLVDVQVENVVLPGIYVMADVSGNEIILGRDVLNKLAVFLDGPVQQTEILDDATTNRLRGRRNQ